MSYFIMPVRTRDEPEVDDYVIWCTVEDVPVFQGAEDEVCEWWREEFGRRGLNRLRRDEAFERAHRLGSNSYVGNGHWDDELRAACGNKAGILRREKLREFLVAFWADGVHLSEGCIDDAAELLEPFEWEKDAESDGDGR